MFKLTIIFLKLDLFLSLKHFKSIISVLETTEFVVLRHRTCCFRNNKPQKVQKHKIKSIQKYNEAVCLSVRTELLFTKRNPILSRNFYTSRAVITIIIEFHSWNGRSLDWGSFSFSTY